MREGDRYINSLTEQGNCGRPDGRVRLVQPLLDGVQRRLGRDTAQPKQPDPLGAPVEGLSLDKGGLLECRVRETVCRFLQNIKNKCAPAWSKSVGTYGQN